MKSKTSYFNKTIFKKNVTHYWPIWGMILLWNLFILPFMIYNSSLQYKHFTNFTQAQIEGQRLQDITSLLKMYISPGMLFFFAVASVMAVFSYLYHTRSAYTFHAFPVTRLEMFITNYISGLLFLIVPEIIGFLGGTIVSVVCGYTSINYLFTGLLFAGGISFFLYTFTVFIAMFTGQLFAVPVFSLILNFLVVGGRLIVSSLVEALSYGITWGFSGSKLDVLSPLYYYIRRVGFEYDYSGEAVAVKGFTGTAAVIGYACAAIVLAAAAYLVYRKRHIETAGNLISVSWICPVFRWGAAFCGGSLFGLMFCSLTGVGTNRGMFFMLLASALFFGIAFFFGAQMFLEKGFRVFHKKRFIECGAFLGVLVCLLVGIECDLFGQEKKMPKLQEVEEVYLTGPYTIGGDDAELIQQALDIHSQIIASKKEFERFSDENMKYGDDLLSVSVKYYLKNGSVLRRAYQIPATKEILADTDTVAGKMMKFSVEPEVFLDNLFGGDYKNVRMEDGNMDFYNEKGEYEDRRISREAAEKLYDAVVADALAGNFKNYIMNCFQYDWMEDTDEVNYYNTINLRFSYENKSKERVNRLQREYSMWSGYGSTNISFDKNCKNVIAALTEAGIIKGEHELNTAEEMSRINNGVDDVID